MSTISVLGRTISVVEIPGSDLSLISKDQNCLGYFDGKTIYLSIALQGEEKKRVLIHELIHVVLAVSGLTNLIEENLEEAIADAMESLSANISF